MQSNNKFNIAQAKILKYYKEQKRYIRKTNMWRFIKKTFRKTSVMIYKLIKRKKRSKNKTSKTYRKVYKQCLKSVNKSLRGYQEKLVTYYLNMKNIFRYGTKAPRIGENIWVNPQEVTMALEERIMKDLYGNPKREASGKVVTNSWPIKQAKPIKEVDKIKHCIKHWVYGVPWEDTGVFELTETLIRNRGGAFDYLRNKDDIVKRYENLDLIFEQVKKDGKLREMEEINPNYHRKGFEKGVINIGPNGEPFFGGGAYHRFAIAYILKVPYPAQIGIVHISAIPYLYKFRNN